MFPCTQCGLCCQNLHRIQSDDSRRMDRGDGVCVNFDITKKQCKVYEERPLICRIEESYEEQYVNFYSKVDFYVLNAKACNQLQDAAGLPADMRVDLALLTKD